MALYMGLSFDKRPAEPNPAQRDEFVLTLRELAATWTLQEAVQTWLRRYEASAAARVPSMGKVVDSVLEDAPHTPGARALAAALLLAFGAAEPARALRNGIDADTPIVSALDALLADPVRAGPADIRVLEDAGLPRRAIARLQLRVLPPGERREAVARWIETDRRQLVVRLGILEVGAGILTLAGLVGLVALRPLASMLHRGLGGLTPPAPFDVPGIRLYVAAMAWFAVSLGAGGALGAWVVAHDATPSAQVAALVADVVVTGLVGVGVATACRTYGMPLGAALGLSLHRLRGRIVPLLCAIGSGWSMALPITFALSVATALVTRQQPVVTNPVIPLLANAESPVVVASIASTTVLVAPFFEEVFFRGFLYRALRDHARPLEAMLLTSAVFAAIHPSPFTILPLFGFGLLLAWLYETTGSLWPGIVVHALFNAGTLAWIAVTLHEPPWL